MSFLWNFLPHVFEIQHFKHPLPLKHAASLNSNNRECRWWCCYDIFVNKLIIKPQSKYPHTLIHSYTHRFTHTHTRIVNFIYHIGCVVEVNNKMFRKSKITENLCVQQQPQQHRRLVYCVPSVTTRTAHFKWKPNAANTLDTHIPSHPHAHNIAKQTRFSIPKTSSCSSFIFILQLILVLQLFLCLLGKCVCLYMRCVCVACVCVCKQKAMHSYGMKAWSECNM